MGKLVAVTLSLGMAAGYGSLVGDPTELLRPAGAAAD